MTEAEFLNVEFTGKSSPDTKGDHAIVPAEDGSRAVDVPLVDAEVTARGGKAWGAPYQRVMVPKGVPQEHFQIALINAYHEYMETGTWTVEGISRRSGLTAPEVSRLATTPNFKKALSIRGVVGDNQSGLTVEQDAALLVLTAPDGKTLDQKLKALRISHTKYRGWMKQAAFRRAMENVTQGLLHDNSMSLVQLEALSNAGDLNSIKYKHMLNGTYDPNRTSAVDIQMVVAEVFRVIATHVTNPDQLQAIAQDIQKIDTGTQTRKVIDQW